MTHSQYERLLESVKLATHQDARLAVQSVYYSARAEHANRIAGRYQGKLSINAKCVSVDPWPQPGQEAGLHAPVILYMCDDRSGGDVYRRTTSHRGVRGVLSGDVVCVIQQSWYDNT